VVYFVCTLIWGLIVNTIVTKIEIATNFSESVISSLIDSGSNLSNTDIQIEQDLIPEVTEVRTELFEKGSLEEGVIATLFREAD